VTLPPSPSPPPPTAPPTSVDLLATATFGLEAVVARELAALGYETKTVQAGRIRFHGDAAAICRANLWLRAADRVLLEMGRFEARDFGQLFDRTFALPWHEWLGPDACFPVTGRSIKSQLSSVPACQKIVKKAVVEKLKSVYGVEWFEEKGPKYSIEVALLEDEATLTIDTTGPGLHKRGYRALVGKAPLKETLAAAMILLSFWKPERQLVDPFCGAGTIPIEAALIGRNIAPGLGRDFAAESWSRLPAALWQAARDEARRLIRPDLPLRIIGTDIDENALRLARHHAELAGVAGQIHFQHADFRQLSSSHEHGCVICNPPYGARLGEMAEVQVLYRAMPEVFRRLKTWSFYVLTAYPEFERLVGQEASRRRKLYNGRLECTYYQFYGPKPVGRVRRTGPVLENGELEARVTTSIDLRGTGSASVDQGAALADTGKASATQPAGSPRPACGTGSATVGQGMELGDTGKASATQQAGSTKPPAKPAFGGLSAKAREQAEIFRSRLAKRARHLRRLPTRQGITCYRIYERDIPEVPLVVDRYEDCLHIAEFERPHDRTPAEHGDWLDLMQRTAGEVLDVPQANIFLKRHTRQRGDSQYERVATRERTLVAHEGGLQFEVNLSDYLDTGLFLDHRITRGMVRQLAAGKRFLNLFAYTGAFTVYAAAGGAESTTTVDLSASYLEWAGRNLALNGLAGPQHALVRDDSVEFLDGCGRRPRFDLAVIDPPTFSNSKRLDHFWDIQRDHAALVSRVLELLTPGGTLFFSTNFRRFKLADEEIRGATVVEISRQTVPPDFRNRRIHRCWRITK
jgi:23S rRNA (guanine2445-N2)-methyltransferase / 23S rRNA (guanine2069-N7)-methyltransferase